MKKNIFYAQSGGVTPVINATAAGLIDYVTRNKAHFGKLFVGKNGIAGALNEELIADAKQYLVENLKVEVLSIEGRPAQIELPSSVVLKVTESPEGVRGDSANNVQKQATLETGKIINVPLFIKEGELVKVSTVDGTYMSRA